MRNTPQSVTQSTKDAAALAAIRFGVRRAMNAQDSAEAADAAFAALIDTYAILQGVTHG